MATLRDIRRRIQAVKSTQKVTRAMQLVAAAKLRRAQMQSSAARAYTSSLYDAAIRVSRRLGTRAPLMWSRPNIINCIDLLIVTSDRGLCGGFNENLLRTVEEAVDVAADHNISAKIFMIGKKGAKYFTRKKLDVTVVPSEGGEEGMIGYALSQMTDRYARGESAGSTLGFNRFKGGARYEITFWNLLPIHKRGDASERNLEYLYEPTRTEALERMTMDVLRSSVNQAILESRTAELAARMAAMDNATKNANDMIAHLTSIYNRARQESITSELIDILGGVEALK